MGNLLFYCTWAYLFYPLNTVKDEEADRVWRRPCTNIHRALKNWKGSWRWSWWGFTVILKILSLVDNQRILRIQIKKKKKKYCFPVYLLDFKMAKHKAKHKQQNNKTKTTTKQKTPLKWFKKYLSWKYNFTANHKSSFYWNKYFFKKRLYCCIILNFILTF